MNSIKSRIPAEPRDGFGHHRFSKAKVVAERLGVCRRTIFRWANAGLLTRHKINDRVVLFDEAEVLALVEGARVVSR